MYDLTDLETFVYRDLAHASTNNDRLDTPVVDAALNQGYKEFARLTRCFVARRIFKATSGVEDYPFPPDMLAVRAVNYETTTNYLKKASIHSLTHRLFTWRGAASTEPESYYFQDARVVSLHPPPSVTGTVNFWVEGYVVPFSIGDGIKSAARVSNVTTITTNTAHGLTANLDIIRIGGVAAVGATYFYHPAVTVASVPSADSFTYADAQANDTGAGGLVSWADAVPILAAQGNNVVDDKTHVPALPADYQMALVDFAVWTLAGRALADAEEAQRRAEVAQAAFQAKVAQHKAEL